MSAVKPGFISRGIIRAQEQGGYAAEDARWHHAAIYLGEQRVCEATGAGVGVSHLYKYIGSHRIRIRRDVRLKEADGWKIALNGLFRLGAFYSYGTILRMLVESARGFWKSPIGTWIGSSKAEICSKLYADAYTITTSRVLGNAAGSTTVPAYLSNTTELEDQPVCWCAIQ